MSVCFGSDVRLKKRWQFDLVFRTGRRENGALVRLFYINMVGKPTQVGVTVGRRIANAAGRNRGKRILREAMRRLIPEIRDGYWIVASMRDKGLLVGSRQVYEDIAHLLFKSGIILSPPLSFPWR